MKATRFAAESEAAAIAEAEKAVLPRSTDLDKVKLARARLGTLEAAMRAGQWAQARVSARGLLLALRGLE